MLVGREALRDTMKDLIVDALSALIISILGFFSPLRGISWQRTMKKLERLSSRTIGYGILANRTRMDKLTENRHHLCWE